MLPDGNMKKINQNNTARYDKWVGVSVGIGLCWGLGQRDLL